ncbi:hypothetical protein FSARC_5131 [Fusarium sarcochroum]|uniref:Xylanolytic transcriptional activator regulatory domain-containing protein n=1 Tax=Fusarium sarcochroum TaxID=1208366 RepID=A0A8H4U049_9HYPO|nr:hypothetical protein FSARC_5131 [Fusarium sarcochroum]
MTMRRLSRKAWGNDNGGLPPPTSPCDNVRPTCGFCVRHRAKCVYADTDDDVGDEGVEDAVSNRQIMDRLNEIKEMLQKNDSSPKGFSDAEPLFMTADTPQTSAATSPWARFSAGTQYRTQTSSRVQPTEVERLPFAALRCESLLRWPALYDVVPSDARDIDSFPLSPGYIESSVQRSNSGGKGIDDAAFVPLCRKFLAYVHPRNPVLDGHQLIRHARAVEENGLKWDSSSCLVLLACALAEYTGMWIRPNEYPVPPTPEQLQQLEDSDQTSMAEPYYAAAQKRMGLLGSSIEDIQCFVFATIFEKFALRPLRAWYYVQQACSRLETHLRQRGERPRAPFRESNPQDYHLEQRLFWTCFRAESELVFELGLRPSALESFSYPEPLPSPPEGLLTGQTPRTEGSQVDPDEEQRQVDERGWYYYLSEISIRRTVDETLNLLYRNGEEYWMKNPLYLIRQYHECEQQISQWHYHLPAVVQFESDKLPEEEFAAALQGRASLWREYTLRPIFYYVLHQQSDEPIPPQAHALALKELEVCINMVHRLAFHRRHGGIWLISRKIFLCACLILAAALNPHRVQPPEQWHIVVEIAIQTLERWALDALDVRRMADILRHMYSQT